MNKKKKIFEMHDDNIFEYRSGDTESPLESPDISGQLDQVVNGLSGIKTAGQVYLVDVRKLDPYPGQPFRQYPPEKLQELADDIARVGILSPILARRDNNRFQILSGHNRWAAARLAGFSEVPVLTLEADDDQAALILTGTNLRQRERLLPSEKAFAYKMQMEALKRQGMKGDGAYDASAFITGQTGDSRMQIHRYIRLTELIPGLLELLDRGKISMTPAVSVSYLSPESQSEVLRCVLERGAKLTIEKGNSLKNLSAKNPDGNITSEQINSVMLGVPRPAKSSESVNIPYEMIRRYIPESVGRDELEKWIIEAVINYGSVRKTL